MLKDLCVWYTIADDDNVRVEQDNLKLLLDFVYPKIGILYSKIGSAYSKIEVGGLGCGRLLDMPDLYSLGKHPTHLLNCRSKVVGLLKPQRL